ncbi:MAG: hypothetical protein L0H70_02575 [Xanthomonadales bacterium]|nr:hypothetical protein [Xanthomonadales bacterium]
MQPILRLLILTCTITMLAACSHHGSDAPLAYVPANTPYVVANLKPIDNATAAIMLDPLNRSLPAQVNNLKSIADALDHDQQKPFAQLSRALANELDGKTAQQFASDVGMDMHGLGALYGVGLSPVWRLPLADPAKFQAFISRLETAYGKPLAQAKSGKFVYRHLQPTDTHVQLLLDIENQQVVFAIAPAAADQALIDRILGVQRPEHSAEDTQLLKNLAKANGYLSSTIGMLNIQRLPAMMDDPLFKAMIQEHDSVPIPSACATDFARITARVPLLSFGYTQLSANHIAYRTDVALAPDIVKAFTAFKVPLPGFGSAMDAPLDYAMALPMPQLQSFWKAQAAAVSAKPFTCPLLSKLNTGLPMLANVALPMLADLRGVRLSIDQITEAASGSIPGIRGRLLIASTDPTALLVKASSFVSDLGSLQLKADSQPVALPAPLTAMTRQPGWIAMNDKALAIGLGSGEGVKLTSMLTAATGNSDGVWFKAHMDGHLYSQYVTWMGHRVQTNLQQAQAGQHGKIDAKSQQKLAQIYARLQTSIDAAQAAAKQIKQNRAEAHTGTHGLVITFSRDLR